MRPITPRMRAELGSPDNPHRALIEAQSEQRSSSKKTKTDFQTADTFTARTADFTASNALTAAGNTVVAALASAPAANALYEAHFKVSINTTVPASNSNTLKITVSVETDPTGAAVWTEQFSFDYEVTRKVGEPAVPVIWDHERLPVRVTGFNSSGQLRLKLKSVSGPGTVSVHGFNLATNADLTNGVTYHTGPAMDFLDSGQGVTLADTVVSKISHGSSDGNETDLGGPALATDQAPFITARIVWGKDDSKDIAIDRIKAFLNPCVDGVPGNKNVTWFLLRPYALTYRFARAGTFKDIIKLVPLADPVRVPAGDGTTAQDYTFTWHERDVVGPGHTIVSLDRKPRPKSVQPDFTPGADAPFIAEYSSSAVTYVFIWALKADGTPATNVGWARNSAVTEVVNGSRRLRAIEVSRIGDAWAAENVTRGAATRPVFRMDVQCGSYAAANLEFTSSVLDLTGSPTETVEFVGLATTVGGSVFEVRNDADSAWLPFTDGQTAAEVGVSQRQTYKVRWRASPNTETDATPTLFEIGVRDVKRVWLSDIATVRATWAIPDLAELVPAIPEAEIVVQKTGEQDFLDRITVLLSENYIGSLMFRVWVGDISRPRSEWMHKDDFVLVDDYDPRAADVTVLAHSPLVLLNGVLPVYNTTTQQQVALRLANKTPSQVWDEIVGVQLAIDVPVKYRGDVSALGSSVLLTKNITDSDGKTELDAVAHTVGCVFGTTRGKITAFDMFTPGGIKAVFPSEKITWKSTSPGMRQRVPEFLAKYDYQDETQNYRGNARVITVDANTLTRMGGTARIDANRNLRDEVCRWVPTEKIAKAIGQRRVNALGTGMLLWRFTSTDPYPELEFGDRVAVETTQFMARDPTLGTLRALKGALWAIGRVVEYDVEGRELAIWIQGYADILGAGSSAAVRLGLGWPGHLSQDYAQMLVNPGFEEGFVFWADSVAGSSSVIIDSSKSRGGNKYLQVSAATGLYGGTYAATSVGGTRFYEVSPGDAVQYGGWAYRESGTSDVYYVIQILDKDLNVLGTITSPTQNTAAWAFIQTQYIVAAGVKYVAFFAEVNHAGTATIARFDDCFLRMAFVKSTTHNPQASIPPTVGLLSGAIAYDTGGSTNNHMWACFNTPGDLTLLRPDGSTVIAYSTTIYDRPAAPTLSQVAAGALGARTRFVRVALAKLNGAATLTVASFYRTSTESSLAINANNLLKVTSPAAVAGYDGYVVLVGATTNNEVTQGIYAGTLTNAVIPFGTDWTEPTAGAATSSTTNTPYNSVMDSGFTIAELSASTTYKAYVYWDASVGSGGVGTTGAFRCPALANVLSAASAQQQNGDGMIPMSLGATSVITPAAGGSNPGTTGGGRYL